MSKKPVVRFRLGTLPKKKEGRTIFADSRGYKYHVEHDGGEANRKFRIIRTSPQGRSKRAVRSAKIYNDVFTISIWNLRPEKGTPYKQDRGKGFLGMILREALEMSKGNKKVAIVAENQELADYYSGFGFENTFRRFFGRTKMVMPKKTARRTYLAMKKQGIVG